MSEREDGVDESRLEWNAWRYATLSRPQAEGEALEMLPNEKAELS